MNAFEQFRLNMTRRYFFSQGSNVIGAAALASLIGMPTKADAAGSQSRISRCGADTFSGQGQTGDLPAHGRRTFAVGFI